MRRIIYILFLYCFLSNISVIKGQVLVSDSLALVDLYNQCGGNSWTNNSGWLTTLPVSSWQGVTVMAGRVDVLQLISQNLTGSLPNSFCNLTEMRYLYLAHNNLTGDLPSCFSNLVNLNSVDFTNNKFTGAIPSEIVNFPHFADLIIDGNDFTDLPDMTSMPELSILTVTNNKFTFEDFIPNNNLNFQPVLFEYSPQDSVDTRVDSLVGLRDTVSFSTSAIGTSYQWYKNGTALIDGMHFNGVTTNTLTINYCTFADTGEYTCRISHSSVNFLELNRHPVIVDILDNRLSQKLNFIPGGPNICGNNPVRMLANNEAALPFEITLVSGPGKLNGDTLIPFTEGTFVLNYSNDGNDYFLPLDKDTTVNVALPVAPDNITIEKEIPIEFGEKFYVAAISDDTSRFTWITPSGDSIPGNTFSIPRTFKEHEGTYILTGIRNSCFCFREEVLLLFEKKVKLFQLLTPNEDGKNDVLIIEGIFDFPDNKITVFNAWQQIVYAKENYGNDWSGDALPAGTYYIRLELKESGQIIQSSFVLRR